MVVYGSIAEVGTILIFLKCFILAYISFLLVTFFTPKLYIFQFFKI